MRKLISLYTGAGGLDFGFEAAGFQTAVAVEIDPTACETLRRNTSWPVVRGDLFDTPTPRLLEISEMAPREPDLVIGGPPCQPFSKSGYWHRGDAKRLDDPRATTLHAFMRVVADALPAAFLLENVPGLAYNGKDEGLQLLGALTERINREHGTRYRLSVRQLKATDFGVPQVRERVFVVAARDGSPFKFPEPTHGEQDLFLKPVTTAWDAIGDLTEPESDDLRVTGKWAGLLPSIPEGRNYLHHTSRGGGLPLFGWRRRFWSFLLKLAKNKPSWTIQAQPGPATGPFHWKNRKLSMRELGRLQTFPDDIEIAGSHREVQRQIGNAVPSLLAEILAREIRTQILGDPAFESGPTLLPRRQSPPPPPEPVWPVAPPYLSLVGEHSAHPGTGAGYAAVHRRQSPEPMPQ